MITLKKQNEINSKFITYFKNVMSLHKVNANELIDNFKKFEQNNNYVQNDEVAIIILMSMLDTPYYKKLKAVNSLVKFRVLQKTLELIKSDEIDNDLISKFDKLIKI